MERFLGKCLLFVAMLVAVVAIGLLIPATPRARTSQLFAAPAKEQRLRDTRPPRLIFVGGSSLSFGLDSASIEKAIGMPVINTGIHAGLGLRYLLESTLPFVQATDVVVLAAEYSLFFNDYDYESEELVRMVLDVSARNYAYLSLRQKIRLLPWVPRYAFTKMHPWEYGGFTESDVHGIKSFNDRGDVVAHWPLPRRDFSPFPEISGTYNPRVLEGVLRAKRIIEEKGGTFLVTYPCLQDLSFDVSAKQIEKVAQEYKSHGLTILGTPERYRMPDNLMFDTPYHLSKAGVDRRTQLFIEDFRNYQKHVQFDTAGSQREWLKPVPLVLFLAASRQHAAGSDPIGTDDDLDQLRQSFGERARNVVLDNESRNVPRLHSRDTVPLF